MAVGLHQVLPRRTKTTKKLLVLVTTQYLLFLVGHDEDPFFELHKVIQFKIAKVIKIPYLQLR